MAKEDNQLSPGGPSNRRKIQSQLTKIDSFRSVILVLFLLVFFGVGVSCRILYYIDSCLYICNCSGSIISAGEEIANVSAIVYL